MNSSLIFNILSPILPKNSQNLLYFSPSTIFTPEIWPKTAKICLPSSFTTEKPPSYHPSLPKIWYFTIWHLFQIDFHQLTNKRYHQNATHNWPVVFYSVPPPLVYFVVSGGVQTKSRAQYSYVSANPPPPPPSLYPRFPRCLCPIANIVYIIQKNPLIAPFLTPFTPQDRPLYFFC